MIRHVVMFRWRTGTTPDHVAAVEEGLGKLPGEIPEIHRYTFGADLGINVGNFQFAVVADFQSRDDYLVYRDAPVHRALIEEKIRPNIEDRTAIQFEID
jgi:Stress responsive A/B Barrel Domain